MSFLLQIHFTSISFLWLLGCLGIGIAYSFVLYGSSTSIESRFKSLLFSIRALLISFISFLLFAPLIKISEQRFEKPLIILALDNSSSILSSKANNFDIKSYLKQIDELEKDLSSDYEIRTFYFDSRVKEAKTSNFDGRQTDISAVFKQVNNQFSNRNIGAIILASDGIYNRGGNPQYESKKISAPIYSIALGDSTAKRDLLIANINYNELAFFDSNFEIEISVEAFQAKGSSSMLNISSSSGIIYSKLISINTDEFRQNIKVLIPANRIGLQQFQVQFSKLTNELSYVNNVQSIFVQVVNAKKEIVILANAPHPDITALKQSIENNKNYVLKVILANDFKTSDISNADLIILHQLPSKTNRADLILNQVKNKSQLYVLGAQSDISAFVSSQSVLEISSQGMMQEALVNFKPDFYAFNLSDDNKTKISNFSPLLSPFGSYKLKGSSNVLMSQQIGKTTTDRPLLVFAEDSGVRIGILTGEGLWRWRLEDFQENSNHNAINELVQKTIQYLATRDDKRKFRVYSSKNTFDENEAILLNAELYNDAFDLVNSPDVNITLRNKSDKAYSFLFSKTSNAYFLNAGILPAGEYRYEAKTILGKKSHQAEGQIIVNEQQLELKQSKANHQLMYLLAMQNGGEMVFPHQIGSIPSLIKANETVKTIVYEDSIYEELIDLKFIFFLLLILLSVEWFMRKRNGEI